MELLLTLAIAAVVIPSELYVVRLVRAMRGGAL